MSGAGCVSHDDLQAYLLGELPERRGAVDLPPSGKLPDVRYAGPGSRRPAGPVRQRCGTRSARRRPRRCRSCPKPSLEVCRRRRRPLRPAHCRGLRDPGRAGPRRHGRRLQGPAGRAQPAGGPQDDPGRRPRRRGATWPASGPRPRRSPACSTPTSCRSTRSASTTACPSSRWSSCAGGSLDQKLDGTPLPPQAGGRRWSRRWPGPCTRPTSRASSTAT